MDNPFALPRGTTRVRHDLKLRVARVAEVIHLTPRMTRIVLETPDFEGFTSLSYDDHCKLFFPLPGTPLPEPTATENGLSWPPDQPRPEGRDYTPRFFEPETNRLTIDFVLHGDGPATAWAAHAHPGDHIGVGGPRGSFVVTGTYDYYLLVGDETALPAIARRLEELPADARAIALIEIHDDKERQTIVPPANTDLVWIPRNGAVPGEKLLAALKATVLPEGTGYAFVAGEADMAKAARAHLVETLGLDPDFVKASGYWRLGEGDFDDGHAH